MPKKKSKKTVRPTSRLVEFWRSQRGRKLRGACYLLFSVFLAVAMTSFFISWPSHNNWLGALGFHLSKAVIQNTFGIASYGLPFLLFLYGLRLLGRNPLPWRNTLWSTLFWMVWISSVVGYVFGRWGKGNIVLGNYAGVTGDFIAQQCYHLIKWGTLVLFAFIAVVYLVFVHHVRIRAPKVNIAMPDLSGIKNIATKVKTAATATASAVPAPEEEAPKATPTSAEPQAIDEPKPDEEGRITFSIDDEFSRINQRAQARAQAENDGSAKEKGGFPQPTFTISESQP